MTKVQLRDAIKREARVKTATNLDALIDEIVADIMRDYCNKSRYWELLSEGVAIALVAGQQAYSLPADYQNLEVVRYGRGPSPTTFRVIDPQPETVKQTWSGGVPRFYRLVRGPKISFFPFANIVVADVLTIDYYIDPATLYTTDGADFPIPRLESAVKKDAIARVQRFYAANVESQMTDRDSAGSYIAGESASK